MSYKVSNFAKESLYLKLENGPLFGTNKQISFAQNLEDIRLARVFNQNDGFFVDVGSSHPVDTSVTFLFNQMGWNGLCIDAFPIRQDLYEKLRPNSELISAVINDGSSATFYEVLTVNEETTGLSTTSKKIADKHKQEGFLVKETAISGITLNDLLLKHNVKRDFELLVIDLEGTAIEAVGHGFFDNFRPKVFCLETTFPNSPIKDQDLISFVKANDYVEIVSDGLNSFFVPKELEDDYQLLAAQPCPFIDGHYWQWSAFAAGNAFQD